MPTYPNAPIHEAVFDIKVDSVENIDIDTYEELAKTKLKDFSKTEKRVVVSGHLKFNKDTNSPIHSSDKKVLGVVYSNDKKDIKIQFRKDGFTLNMMPPYSNWEEFSGLAFKYWDIYKSEIKPSNVNRIALRYINKIQLPIEGLTFEDYLQNMPTLPNPLKSTFSNLLVRFESELKESGNKAHIIRTFNNVEENKLPFILDIDVFKKSEINLNKLEEEFEQLRVDKNSLFESLITDKTRELFK